MTTNPQNQLLAQWLNPGDILGLLLLIGGDIVQKAIAQTVGYTYSSPVWPARQNLVLLTPVAFSFGWVAFCFNHILLAAGSGRLMPSVEDSAIVLNCGSNFTRASKFWALNRLLRDYEIKNTVDPANDSLRIDIFELGPLQTPSPDLIWWLEWLIIAVQTALGIVTWVFHDDWAAILVILAGSLLGTATCCLPKWREEKWACRVLTKRNVSCITRGNGHKHVMVLVGRKGAPEMETMATDIASTRPETFPLSIVLAALWICLLLSVAELTEHTWYILSAGCVGMLQNFYSAGAVRSPATAGFDIRAFA